MYILQSGNEPHTEETLGKTLQGFFHRRSSSSPLGITKTRRLSFITRRKVTHTHTQKGNERRKKWILTCKEEEERSLLARFHHSTRRKRQSAKETANYYLYYGWNGSSLTATRDDERFLLRTTRELKWSYQNEFNFKYYYTYIAQ